MLDYIRQLKRYALVQPRTYWCEFPFFTMISGFRQKFCLGSRPEDLTDIDTVEQKAWEKHQAYLNRLERLPLEKAEYYVRLKEVHGINTVRGLSKITGEDWSYIAKILRTLELPEPVKGFLQSNRTEPAIVKFFHLRRLLDIVRQGEERLQLARFRELMEELENGGSPVDVTRSEGLVREAYGTSVREVLGVLTRRSVKYAEITLPCQP
jgi:hypothetical protein